MAKVKFSSFLDENSVELGFLGSGSFSVNGKGTVATYNDFGGGAIKLHGKGFETDIIGFGLTDGSIKDAQIILDGKAVVRIDGSISVKTFNQALSTGDLEGILGKLLAKNDKVSGSSGDDGYVYGFGGNDTLEGLGGDDTLNGGKGNDDLFGGGGNDTFSFGIGFGKDTIKDFDADGGAGAQDLIQILGSASYEIREDANGNAVIWLSDADTLTIAGVGSAQIDGTDFLM